MLIYDSKNISIDYRLHLKHSPKALDGTSVGDFGFDPLGLTETLPDLNYVKAAELKHARVAMVSCSAVADCLA